MAHIFCCAAFSAWAAAEFSVISIVDFDKKSAKMFLYLTVQCHCITNALLIIPSPWVYKPSSRKGYNEAGFPYGNKNCPTSKRDGQKSFLNFSALLLLG